MKQTKILAPMTAEMRQLTQDAAALATLTENSPVWQAFTRRIDEWIREADGFSGDILTAEEKRGLYAVQAGALRGIREELDDLRTGKWREWPVMKNRVVEEETTEGE